jgi:hypothetical protein
MRLGMLRDAKRLCRIPASQMILGKQVQATAKTSALLARQE